MGLAGVVAALVVAVGVARSVPQEPSVAYGVAQGEAAKISASVCASCHGDNLAGGRSSSLIDDAFTESVLLATPTTLVALLKSVSYGWRQESLADNAREIAAAARELHDRVRFFTEHLGAVGRGLSQATRAYNQAAGSLTGRVLPQGRRIEQLGAGSGKRLAEPELQDVPPREIESSFEPEGDA